MATFISDQPAQGAARTGKASGTSARSLLLTILGEFVHPRGGTAWTGSLVSALGVLGVEEKAARQTISRTAGDGLLTSRRHGRRVSWELTPSGNELLAEGTARIYGFLRDRRSWNGDWLVVAAAVPETQRSARHKLRTRLTWLGLGSPTPGIWISPDTGKEAGVKAALAGLELQDRAFAWVGRRAAGTDPRSLIGVAWDLQEVRARYQSFTAQFDERQPADAADTFVAQVELIHAWRAFPFIDPALPAELLPQDWPGPAAAALFHARRDRWHRRAQAEWDRMEQAAAERT